MALSSSAADVALSIRRYRARFCKADLARLNEKGRLVKGGPGDWNAGNLVEHLIQARRELTSQIALGIKAADWFADRIAVLVQDYYRR
jgi:hypothetical protein